MEQIKKILFVLLLTISSYANADLTDIKFGQMQIADSQWNVNACLNTTTCQIYSKQPGTAYKIPWTSGQVSWAAGDYVKFEMSGNNSFPYTAKQYDSAGNVKSTLGDGKIVNMGPDYFFFVGSDNNTGQLFSGSSGMSGTSGVSWTGTLNPSVAQANTYADATYSTVPLTAGQTATSTPSSSASSPPPAASTGPISPNTNNANLGFESGTTQNWTISNGTGTEKTSGWSPNGDGVRTSKGMTNYSPGGGKTWTVTPYGTYMMAIQAGGDSPNFDPAMTSLGLTTTDIQQIRSYLTGLGGNSTPTNASWAKRTVALEAGKTYVIAWQYLSTDYVPFNDGSAMTLVHSTDISKIPTLNNETKRYALLGFTNPGTGNYATNSYGATGWQLATITVPVDGDYILGFSSFNLGDTALSPILFVDDLQGATTLNGTTFGPIAPNAGSSAPTTGGPVAPACPNNSTCSTTSFNANSGFANRANVWSQQNGNKVIIEQIGNYNVATVQQTGNKNYAEIDLTGSNNTTAITQSSTGATTTNYIELTISGNGNTTNLTQSSTGGAKGILATVNNASNSLTVNQSGTGNHYSEISLSGGNKTVDVTQSGSAGHMANITLTGGATSITTTQTGSTQQFYSINHNCAQISCSAITVTQGQ